MKNIITLLFLLLMTPLVAQEYTPMLETGKIWNMVKQWDYGATYPFKIEVIGTIEINNITYFIVENNIYECEILMREDVLEKKVYRLINDQDVLMFDFNLGVGDLAVDNFPASPFPFPPFITGIETGTFFNIPNLKYYTFDFSSELIESIGFSRNGIANCFDITCQSLGIYEWDTLVGMNEVLATNDYFVKSDINVFYNSKSNMLQLINNTEEVQLKLFSILGAKIVDTKIFNEKRLPNLNSGVYIYQLSKGKSTKTGKVLID